MRWMTRRRPGYGFAVIIGVLLSAWAHDFGAWCWQVVPLFGFARQEPLAFVQLVVPEPPPPPVTIEAMPKWKAPAPPASKRLSSPADGLVLKKKKRSAEMREMGILAILGSSDDHEMASVFGAELSNSLEGGVVGGLIGAGGEDDAIGVGGLGLRGTGEGGGGTGGIAGIGDVRAGGGRGAVGIGSLGTGKGYGSGALAADRARTAWEQRVRQELQRRWKAKAASDPSRPTLFVRIELTIGRDGVVRTSSLRHSTGDRDADAALLEAISAQPLPAPPEEVPEEDGVVRIGALTLMLPR